MKKILSVLCLLPSLVYSQITFNPVYNLSNTPSATSDYHSVYSWMTHYYAAWGDNGAIMFRHSSDYGQNWGSNKIAASGSGTMGYPVMVGEENNIIMFFHDLNSGVYHIKSTDGGNNWTAPLIISTHSSGITPQIAEGGENRIYAVWEERPGSNYELYFSKSTDFGNSWSAPVNISNTTTTSRWVQIKANYNNIYIAWVETTSYPFSDIYFMKSTDYGNTWTTPVNITNDGRPQNRIYMDVAVGNANDIIYLACDDISSYPVYNYDDIFLMKSTDSGNSWSTAVNITNNTGHSNTPCLLVVQPNIYFTWADNTNSAPAYDNSDIYFKMSPDGGETWQDSIRLCANAETSSRPRICWGIDGPLSSPWIDLSVIWYDYSLGDCEILARNGTHVFVPVELISFSADADENSVKLNWITATETNNKGFEIQRKSGAGEWNVLEFIAGNGSVTEMRRYSYTDKDILPGKYCYRLKQIDFNGTFKYSQEITAEISGKVGFSLMQNYPNPFNPATKIKYNIGKAGLVKLGIYDILGNEISTLYNGIRQAGPYETGFDGSSLPGGIYFCRLQAGEYSSVIKIILLK